MRHAVELPLRRVPLPLLSILGSYLTEPLPPIHPNFANNPATGQPFLSVCLGHQVLCSRLGIPIVYKDIVFQGTQSRVSVQGREENVGFYNTFVVVGPDGPVFQHRKIHAFENSAIRESRPALFSGVNTLFDALMNDPGFATLDWSQVKLCVQGGTALRRALAAQGTSVFMLPGPLSWHDPIALARQLDAALAQFAAQALAQDVHRQPRARFGIRSRIRDLGFAQPAAVEERQRLERRRARVALHAVQPDGDVPRLVGDGLERACRVGHGISMAASPAR